MKFLLSILVKVSIVFHDSLSSIFLQSYFPLLTYLSLSTSTALVQAVSEGLAAADALQLTGLALTAPTGNRALSELSENLISALTVEATVSFLRKTTHISLQRVICVDFSNEDGSQPAPERLGGQGRVVNEIISNSETLLQPACGNRMAITLLLLLEQEMLNVADAQREMEAKARRSNTHPMSPTEHLRLVVCNMPLPGAIPGHTIFPVLRQRRGPSRYGGYGGYDPMGEGSHQQYNGHRHEEQCVIVVRGLAAGIVRAVRAVRALVAASPVY